MITRGIRQSSMTTETRTTTEREEPLTGSDDALSAERNPGRLEGQVSILLRNVNEQRREAREDHRALIAKLDSMNTGLTAKLDSMNAALDAKIDSMNAGLTAKLDRLFYWMLGLFLAIIITVIGSAIGLAIRLG